MKKSIIKLICMFLFLTIILAFHGCISDGNGGIVNPSDDNNDQITAEFFQLDNLNYNTSYATPSQSEKGFLLWDDIDLKSVTFNSSIINIDTVVFSINYGGVEQKKIYRALDDKLLSYRLDKNGEYVVHITAQNRDGTNISGSFCINVASRGRPDSIEFVIKNSKGEIVENVKGGDAYTFTPKILSNGTEITLVKEDIFWKNPQNAEIEHQYNLGNIAVTTTIKHDFYCYVRNNNGKRFNIADEYFTVADNLVRSEAYPEGVYYDYGVPINNGQIYLDANAGYETYPNYFYNNITAEYRFDNGKILPIEISDKVEEGKFSVLISYDNNDHSVYSLSKYDYSKGAGGVKIASYFANGVHYQFDPQKSSANIYLAVWYNRKTEYGFSTHAVNVDSSALDINISVKMPDTFKISSISGKHKNDNSAFNNSIKEFSKPVNNAELEIYVCCILRKDGNVSEECSVVSLSSAKQYFVVNVEAEEGSLADYTLQYTYEGTDSCIKLNSYVHPLSGALERYFVCPKVGRATITVKSRFSDKESSVAINVVDKVFDNERKIDGDSVRGYSVFATVDFSKFIQIKEIRLSSYDDTKFYIRSLRDDEKLEYSKGETAEITAPNEFCEAENGYDGQQITIRIQGSTIWLRVSNVYIIAKFDYKINGSQYSLANICAENMAYFVQSAESLPYHEKNIVFQGTRPVVEYKKAFGETVNQQSFEFVGVDTEVVTIGGNDNALRYSYDLQDNVFHIECYFSHGAGNKMQTYKIEILQIIVK